MKRQRVGVHSSTTANPECYLIVLLIDERH
jgi:transcription termination factor Rho